MRHQRKRPSIQIANNGHKGKEVSHKVTTQVVHITCLTAFFFFLASYHYPQTYPFLSSSCCADSDYKCSKVHYQFCVVLRACREVFLSRFPAYDLFTPLCNLYFFLVAIAGLELCLKQLQTATRYKGKAREISSAFWPEVFPELKGGIAHKKRSRFWPSL